MRIVDLRSDTLTLPTEDMRQSMAEAQLGDDSYDGDPTVVKLENMAAERLGKESALLVISGTMGNLVSILAHTQPGNEIILDNDSHIYNAEVGGLSRIGGLIARPLQSADGSLDPLEVEKSIHTSKGFIQPTGVICVENTHNRHGGTVISLGNLRDLFEITQKYKIPLHMDGARIFNASIASGCEVKEIAQFTDSVTFCLSKGLSGPLGSVVVGSAKFIQRARFFRQMLGGGMRQAGVFAAAGIVALTSKVERLREDHINARQLAKSLNEIQGLKVDLSQVQSNIVNVDLTGIGITSKEFLVKMKDKGILAFPRTEHKIRLVTYRGITTNDIYYSIEQIKACVLQD